MSFSLVMTVFPEELCVQLDCTASGLKRFILELHLLIQRWHNLLGALVTSYSLHTGLSCFKSRQIALEGGPK